ncbi:MAG: hypothetical protein K8T89_25850 [Planctomycetes bacterium]|nr:hypothetical protein [Planctomycetota bacterium]
MEVIYESGELSEADITATSAEFAAMANQIAELVQSGEGEVRFPASGGRGLLGLVVRISTGPAVVAVGEDRMLSVGGSREAVEIFGRNIPDENCLPDGYHVHFEHAGRESHVASDSVPLVMVVNNVA